MSSSTPVASVRPPALPGLEVQEKIGEGGMSVVYRAVHRNLQRTVAVKVLRAPASEAAAQPSWLRESRLMASLAHPNVVGIHDAGEVEGQHYLVMEYMAGGSLRGRMKSGKAWPLDKALALVNCVAGALSHIHAQHVLHLDLKPENILYTADEQTKIADFGLAVPDADADSLLLSRRFRGTIDYCAPESRAGLTLDERFDVFSLATITYELLTGRLPGRVYIPASSRNVRLPKALDDILRIGLARDPNDRYSSIAQFQHALNGACQTASTRRRIPLLVGLTASAALVALSLVLFLRKPNPVAPQPENGLRERPDRLVLLYHEPDDLALFAGDDAGKLASGSKVTVEKVQFQKAGDQLPAGLGMPNWPIPIPVLLIQSKTGWGLVRPLQDTLLAQQAVNRWDELLGMSVPPEKNLLRAGNFEGDCLVKGNEGRIWRAENVEWDAQRYIGIDRPSDQPDNPALLFSNLNPNLNGTRLRCLQPIVQPPPPGSVTVLRCRVRSENGRGTFAFSTIMPAEVPPSDASAAAARIRRLGIPLKPEKNDPVENRWMYFSPIYATPTTEWRTYCTVFESPPFPTRILHRNAVIDITANPPSATDRIWVDDVELFTWQPGAKP
jgi:hypothetical protein